MRSANGRVQCRRGHARAHIGLDQGAEVFAEACSADRSVTWPCGIAARLLELHEAPQADAGAWPVRCRPAASAGPICASSQAASSPTVASRASPRPKRWAAMRAAIAARSKVWVLVFTPAVCGSRVKLYRPAAR
jgi:hypothetical protein